MKDFAVYRGDTLLVMGTDVECAKYMGIKIKSLRCYATPTGKRRADKRIKQDKCVTVDRLEDDE